MTPGRAKPLEACVRRVARVMLSFIAMRLRWSWMGTASLASLLACSTPSVPIPPPLVDLAALTFDQAGPGTVTLDGKADTQHQGGQFFVVDEASGDGVITRAAADGSFQTTPFAAASGDTVRITLETADGRMSDDYCVTLMIGVPATGDVCP